LIKPCNGHIFVKVDEPEEEHRSGLIIPKAFQVKPRTGTIIGSDHQMFSEGQRAIFGPCVGMTVTFPETGEILIISADDIVGLIAED
jgi:co-chaperonin GroES (HSP10)